MRVIYIEVVDLLSFLVFINVVCWFISIRGKVKIFWLDRGINFIGVIDDLKIDIISVEEDILKKFLYDFGIKWIFNFLYLLYFGGVWERMIGFVWRILDVMLMELSNWNVIYDVFCILMVEVIMIINFWLLMFVLVDFDNLFVLIFNVLLI